MGDADGGAWHDSSGKAKQVSLSEGHPSPVGQEGLMVQLTVASE
jgi:hypothetical protein